VLGVASAGYEDLEFNEASPWLSSPVLRQAIMMALDRTTMAAGVLTPFGITAVPVENRFLLPGEPGYKADGSAYDKPGPAAALALLEAHGYKLTNGALYRPDGQAVDLSLLAAADDPVAQQLGPEIASSCAAIGITVTLDQAGPPASTGGAGAWAGGAWAGSEWAGTGSRPAGWEMALELRQVPVAASSAAERYARAGLADAGDRSGRAADALWAQIRVATPAQLPVLYDELDAEAWTASVDLPLVALPVLVVFNTHLLNVRAGPYFGDIAWDEQTWGFRSP
jgi:ABC-type transport system substrate-binding protein